MPRRQGLRRHLDRRLREAGAALLRRDVESGVETIELTVRAKREPVAARREVVVVESLMSTLTSYSGHLRWGGPWTAWHAILGRHPWLADVFAWDGWQIALRWSPRIAGQTKLWRQYWSLASAAAPGTIVFAPVGAFVEFRGRFVRDAVAALGLRRVRLHRGQWAFGAGFPVGSSRHYQRRAISEGWSVAVVREGDWRGRRACRPREVVRVVRPRAKPGTVEPSPSRHRRTTRSGRFENLDQWCQ